MVANFLFDYQYNNLGTVVKCKGTKWLSPLIKIESEYLLKLDALHNFSNVVFHSDYSIKNARRNKIDFQQKDKISYSFSYDSLGRIKNVGKTDLISNKLLDSFSYSYYDYELNSSPKSIYPLNIPWINKYFLSIMHQPVITHEFKINHLSGADTVEESYILKDIGRIYLNEEIKIKSGLINSRFYVYSDKEINIITFNRHIDTFPVACYLPTERLTMKNNNWVSKTLCKGLINNDCDSTLLSKALFTDTDYNQCQRTMLFKSIASDSGKIQYYEDVNTKIDIRVTYK